MTRMGEKRLTLGKPLVYNQLRFVYRTKAKTRQEYIVDRKTERRFLRISYVIMGAIPGGNAWLQESSLRRTREAGLGARYNDGWAR